MAFVGNSREAVEQEIRGQRIVWISLAIILPAVAGGFCMLVHPFGAAFILVLLGDFLWLPVVSVIFGRALASRDPMDASAPWIYSIALILGGGFIFFFTMGLGFALGEMAWTHFHA